MFTRVSTVLIGKAAPSTYASKTIDTLSKGDVALFDQNKNLIIDADDAAAATAVYVGVIGDSMQVTLPNGTTTTKNKVEFSNQIQRAGHPAYVLGAYTAPSQESIEIDLTNSTIVKGHRYVLRIVYKDMFEAPGQFTHTYEVIATDDTAATLGAAFVAKINKHSNRRVSAAFASSKLTLTALAKDDNEGVNSLNEYSVVSMEASLYFTIPGALLSNQPENVPGVVIEKTAGNPGKGYWKQVRDLEMRSMGYKGHVYTDSYPAISQDMKVNASAEYDYLDITTDNLYLSPDNQYIKTTPLLTELFVEKGSASTLTATSQFMKNLDAFIAGEAPAA